MKDSLVVTAPGATAEAIPFIQLWMMLPATLLATWLFTRMTNRRSQVKCFSIIITAFLSFFAFFALVLYPFSDVLHPHDFAESLMHQIPAGLHGFVSMMRNWTFSTFYTVSELWACMVTSVLFWGFANAITSLKGAQRSYGLYTMGGNLGAITAGFIPCLTSNTAWDAVYVLMGILLVAGVTLLLVFRWLTNNALIGVAYQNIHTSVPSSCEKVNSGSLVKTFAWIIRSPYLMCLAILVLCYNLTLNLGELVWKDRLKAIIPDFGTYNSYLGYTTAAIGVGSLIIAALLPRILSRFGWTITAMICPVALMVTGGLFLGTMFCGDILVWETSTTLMIAVFFGAAMEVVGRMTKHSVFDSTKDMAFIPLDPEVKLKGKAAIDGAVSRIGRSGSAAIHQVLIIIFASIANSIPAVAMVIVACFVMWMLAVKALGKQFAAITDKSTLKIDAIEVGETEERYKSTAAA